MTKIKGTLLGGCAALVLACGQAETSSSRGAGPETVAQATSATNLLQGADQIGTSPWMLLGDVRTSVNYAVAPDGSKHASRVVSSGNGHALVQVVQVTPGATYTFSFYAQNNGGKAAAYSVYDSSNNRDIVSPTSYFSKLNAGSFTLITLTFKVPANCRAVGVYPVRDSPGAVDLLVWRASVVNGTTTTPTNTCWSLLPVNRVRVFPGAGLGAAMVNGTIQGSNTGATNGFVTLATITGQPADGQWTEVTFSNATPYRWVKYYGAAGSYGQIAELELYNGTTRLTGAGFGTAGSQSGNPWQNALDGNTATFFDGATPSDDYVGLDLADGHVVATPVISPAGGEFTSGQTVTLSSATSGATVRYTTDGSDPVGGTVYTGPFSVSSIATVRAVATKSCMQTSASAVAQFIIPDSTSTNGGGSSSSSSGGGGSGSGGGGTGPVSQTSIHLGNSLTDTLNNAFTIVAASGGKNLSYNRYTIPGIGTWLYSGSPTGGGDCCSGNIQSWIRSHTPIDHLAMQPFQNMPCAPDGYAGTCAAGDANCAQNRSDAANIEQAWADAHAQNPNVQLWVYMAWPPTPTEGFVTCLTGGAWNRWSRSGGAASDPPSGWSTAPTNWETAVAHQAMWDEAVRANLASLHPSWRAPYIVPAGQVLVAIKRAVEAGTFPGVASNAFWPTFFSNNGTDNHVTAIGAYAVALAFYTSFFQADPRALPDTDLGTGAGVTAAQAAAIQQIVWQTVSGYALSGYAR